MFMQIAALIVSDIISFNGIFSIFSPAVLIKLMMYLKIGQ